MKSVLRGCILLAIVALIALTPALTSRAQGETRCFGLAGADCKLWYSGTDAANASKYSSFVMDYNVTFTLAGTGTNDVDFKVTGTGPFSLDASKVSTTSSDPTAAIAALTMANTLTASLNASGQSQKGSFEFRIVGGNLYFKGDQATQNKWMFVSLGKALSSAMSNPSFSNALSSAMGGGSGSSSNPAMAMLNDPEVMAALAKIPDIPGFIKLERQADLDIGGEKAAQLVMSFDILTLVKSKEFAPILKAGLKSQNQGAEVDDKQIQQIVAIAQTVLKDTKLSITQWVGTNDKLSHGLGIDFVMKVDENTAALLQSNSSSSSAAKPVDIKFHFDIKLTKIGQPVKVEAVKDATEIDTSSMMGGSTGGAGKVATPSKK